MRLTDEGKRVFLEAMQRTGKEVCRIEIVVNDLGDEGLSISLEKQEEAKRLVAIDGVNFDLTEKDEAYLKDFVFDGEGDHLKVGVPHHGCCHGHHHEGGCCHHDHEHGHDDGECCHHDHEQGEYCEGKEGDGCCHCHDE